MTNKLLLNGDAIFCALMKERRGIDLFINEGKKAIRRAPDDRIGASLAFSINQFATGFYGSFERKSRK